MSKNEIKFKWIDFINEKLKNSQNFRIAFTHTSCKGYDSSIVTNDIFELIGDKVLDLVLYQSLYEKYGNTISKEEMDNLRQKLMSRTGLEIFFDALSLELYVKKPPKYELHLNSTVKHNFVEALIWAIYLEDGYEIAYEFITDFIKKEI